MATIQHFCYIKSADLLLMNSEGEHRVWKGEGRKEWVGLEGGVSLTTDRNGSRQRHKWEARNEHAVTSSAVHW